jgi:DnaJ-class molecular chaperone
VHTPALIAIAALILVTLGYRSHVRRHPFKTCRRCRGYGRVPTRTGRGRPKACRRCDGHGIRPRTWRSPTNRARAIARDARR